MDVTLHPLDEPGLVDLLEAAVAGADPAEVMPAPGGAAWDAELRAGFRAFHRSRTLGPEPVERTWVVRVDGVAAGAVRLEPCAAPVARAPHPSQPLRRGVPGCDAAEIGLWLGRRFRGRAVGATAVRLLRAGPAPDALFVARTTAANTAAIGLLRALGATPEPGAEGAVTAAIRTGDHAVGRARSVDTGPGRPID